MNKEKEVFLLVTRQFERVLYFYFRLQKIKINVNKAFSSFLPFSQKEERSLRGSSLAPLAEQTGNTISP
jgi:hypothetical protein